MRVVPSVLFVAALAAAASAVPSPAGARGAVPPPPPFSPAALERARTAWDVGQRDDIAYDVLRSLTTEVGPRLAGTPGDARAVAWALATMRGLGFANVHAESVTVPRWVRGEARAEIVAPWPLPLACCALGGSVAAPDEGIEAEVVGAASLDELKSLGADRVRGRIVFFHGRMERTRGIIGYRTAVAVRSRGAAEAGKLGAVAVVIRSIGTDSERTPHTGGTRYDSVGVRVPALALSNPDADALERQLASGRAVRLRLRNTSHAEGEARSANVIGEIPGRSPRAGIVLLGAHLDSWDLGQGAHDDGAGVATVIAAARIVEAIDRPERTIRVVLYANEEFGTSGARAYAAEHAAELDRHVVAIESDLGAFPVWGLAARVPPERVPLVRAMAGALEGAGVVYADNSAEGGADIGQLRSRGVPVLELYTDARPYFDLHHTANDTFDKIDPRLLRENVSAYAAIVALAVGADVDFGRLPIEPARP